MHPTPPFEFQFADRRGGSKAPPDPLIWILLHARLLANGGRGFLEGIRRWHGTRRILLNRGCNVTTHQRIFGTIDIRRGIWRATSRYNLRATWPLKKGSGSMNSASS